MKPGSELPRSFIPARNLKSLQRTVNIWATADEENLMLGEGGGGKITQDEAVRRGGGGLGAPKAPLQGTPLCPLLCPSSHPVPCLPWGPTCVVLAWPAPAGPLGMSQLDGGAGRTCWRWSRLLSRHWAPLGEPGSILLLHQVFTSPPRYPNHG